MSLNVVIVEGKLPHFEPNTYKEATDGKSAFLSWAVSVRRNWKKEDEQYYPEDLINFKANGGTADLIMKRFNQGDVIILKGRIERDSDYEKDGATIKGQLYLKVDGIDFPEGVKKSEDAGEKKDNKPAAAAPKKNPLSGAGKKNPLAK